MADIGAVNAAYVRGVYKTTSAEFEVLSDQGNAAAQYSLGI